MIDSTADLAIKLLQTNGNVPMISTVPIDPVQAFKPVPED